MPIDISIHDHPSIAINHDLHATDTRRLADRLGWGNGIGRDHSWHRIIDIDTTKTPCTKIPPPGK